MSTDEIYVAAAVAVSVFLAVWFAFLWFRARRVARGLTDGGPLAEAILECMPGGYLAWSADGRIRSSPWLTALLGPEAPSVKPLKALFHEEHAAKIETLTHALKTRGETFTLTLMTADGRRSLRLDGRRARHEQVDTVWVRDVTEETDSRVNLADRLTVSEHDRDALLAMLDTLPIAVWRRDEDLSLTGVNRAYAQAVDRDRADVLVKQLELGDGPGRTAGGRALAELALTHGEPQSESRHIVIGGERRLLEFNEIPVDRIGLIGYARDETMVEELQADLSRHITAHADVLENLAVAIAIYGADTKLKFYNTAYARLWDIEPSWLDGEPTLDEELEYLRERRRLPEFVDFRAFKSDQMRLFTSLIAPMEDLVHLPDGKTLRKRISPHPFGGLLITYEDVTDSLTLERNYNTLIEVQRRTLDNLYEGIALIGADGRLKLCNPAYARIWQLSEADLEDEPHISELLDKSRDLFDSDEVWSDLRERVIGRVTAREPRSGRLERSDGSVLEYAIVPLPDGMVLLSYIDVTDRNRVERALRERNEALEAADRLKTEFIASVSYELRTPLNTIIGFAEILNGDMFGGLNEKQAEYCRGILQSSESLLDLINDILDLATIEAGYMELELDTFDIHAMLVGVYGLTRERARQHQLNFKFECAPTVGTMTADERRLKQVMFNLVSNAINFTPSGGGITLGAERDGLEIVFTVSDTGVGIPEEEHSRVLKKFERGTSQVRHSGAGAGLGLSLVKSFIELHGGEVQLVSQPESGTRIVCRVPAEPYILHAAPTAGAA
ncbi:MAG: ATP-binding protein [Alphaproteobacteria bacterium]